MRPSARGLLVAPSVGALFALLTLGIVWTPSAQAGCATHHRHDDAESTSEFAGLELLSLAGQTPASGDERPTPCSGALCSGSPATPLSAPSLAPPPGTGHWALATALCQVDGARFSASPASASRARPILHPGSIFRPPRLVAHLLIP